MIEESVQGTQIKVIGVGGGGGNAVEHMINQGVQGVQFICANTDAQALNRSHAQQLVQLGSSGLGAGSKPDVGRTLALEAEQQIRDAIHGAHMLFITAGMGGGTGTGAAPVIAKVAREMGILTVGVVTKPFEFEGGRRSKQADSGVSELEANVDSLIVVLNEKLLDVLGDDVTQAQAFAHANDVLKNAVGGISDIIHMDAFVNVDFEDVRTVMSEPGKAMMGTATASGPDRATKAAEAAVTCPLLDGVDLSGARGVLVLIAASANSFKLAESKNAMNTIRRYAAEDAHVIYGAAYDETLGDQLRVTVIATGLTSARAVQQPPLTVIKPAAAPVQPVAQPVAQTAAQPGLAGRTAHAVQPPAQVLRTGTDNLPLLNNPVISASAGHSATHAGVHSAPAGGATDFTQMATPSVWRNARTNAAAKVEALSSNGMEEIEIPAFLRKQAD